MKVIALLCAFATICSAGPAEENEAGKEAMLAGRYAAAAVKFRAAATPIRKRRTTSIFARRSIRPVPLAKHSPPAARSLRSLRPTKLQTNTDTLIIKITQDATNQHISLEPVADDPAAADLEAGRELMFAGEYEGAVGEVPRCGCSRSGAGRVVRPVPRAVQTG